MVEVDFPRVYARVRRLCAHVLCGRAAREEEKAEMEGENAHGEVGALPCVWIFDGEVQARGERLKGWEAGGVEVESA